MPFVFFVKKVAPSTVCCSYLNTILQAEQHCTSSFVHNVKFTYDLVQNILEEKKIIIEVCVVRTKARSLHVNMLLKKMPKTSN